MSGTAFDLEQDILRCWNITTDLGEILDDVESGHMELDEALQALRAYQKVYENRFERCFRRFETYNRECWAHRHRAEDLEQQIAKDLDVPRNSGASMGKKARAKQQKEVDH